MYIFVTDCTCRFGKYFTPVNLTVMRGKEGRVCVCVLLKEEKREGGFDPNGIGLFTLVKSYKLGDHKTVTPDQKRFFFAFCTKKLPLAY